ncbi:dienelactone hydrolase family protein [Patescibacteria group bacterium]|nr:dienelactone hydrolase family protein [Patescibacteria group bacterium]
MTAQVLVDGMPAILEIPETAKKVPGIILVHEIWGLNEQIKATAMRLARENFVVLAPDLLYGTKMARLVGPEVTKELNETSDRSEAQKKLRGAIEYSSTVNFSNKIRRKLNKCFHYLMSLPEVNDKIGVMGFCFGGSCCFNLAVKQPLLKAAVPFYGYAPTPLSQVKNIKCPVLAFYGTEDTALMKRLEALSGAMNKYHINFEAVVYPDTGHAFFNENNPATYNPEAAQRAWVKSLGFLRKYLN